MNKKTTGIRIVSKPAGSDLKIPKYWTPARRLAVAEYLAELKQVLKLQDWTLYLDWYQSAAIQDAYATNGYFPQSRHAVLSVSERFEELSPEAQRQTLVHEMMHCYTHHFDELTTACVLALVNKKSGKLFNAALEEQSEKLTDILTDVFLPFMPAFKLDK